MMGKIEYIFDYDGLHVLMLFEPRTERYFIVLDTYTPG
jgi:hypothetical protein